MRHRFQAEEEGKKRHLRRAKAASDPTERTSNDVIEVVEDEIDPADFFDLEEFGYRRGVHARRP